MAALQAPTKKINANSSPMRRPEREYRLMAQPPNIIIVCHDAPALPEFRLVRPTAPEFPSALDNSHQRLYNDHVSSILELTPSSLARDRDSRHRLSGRKGLNSKERVRATIARQQPDRVPLGLYITDYTIVQQVVGHETFVRNKVKALGMQVLMHNCGANRPLMGMFVDAGIESCQSLQTNADMDAAELLRDGGGHMAFWGSIATETLIAGTPRDARANVRDEMEWARGYPRFILGPSHSIAKGTRYDNFWRCWRSTPACATGAEAAGHARTALGPPCPQGCSAPMRTPTPGPGQGGPQRGLAMAS